MTEWIEKLRQWVAESDNMVFFGGAGVSTESGIPDFRSVDGLYHQKFQYRPENPSSATASMSATRRSFTAFTGPRCWPPGPAQRRPPEAGPVGTGGEAEGRDHPEHRRPAPEGGKPGGAGAARQCSAELLRKCGAFYGLDTILSTTGVPRCPACGGDIKPDVVLYEESLDQDVLARAVHYIRQADLMIIGGTSLVVYPAAGLVQYFRGRHLVVVNKGQTGSGVGADLTIDGPIGEIFAQL